MCCCLNGTAVIESASKVKTVVLDKTGTLTMGDPKVAAMMMGEREEAASNKAEISSPHLVMLVEFQPPRSLPDALCKFLKRSPQ